MKAARTRRKESLKKVSDDIYISLRYLANIQNKGQHPSLQSFFELMLRYNISVDRFLLDKPAGKNTGRRQLDALLDSMADNCKPGQLVYNTKNEELIIQLVKHVGIRRGVLN
ncbi:hypothetical protein OW729_18325 [Clostridium sp. ZC22-4]|uniref:HTH cro/C1-type domain-containing protein n=1 Tax=Clostridium brassicae TaxID=2999072 RepID=A0ABT4DE09_9CLOT|nr:hypothetical protein [Clostridium brassicae]MCY6960555.1 hypothetical protein [Clostridium brassicae]